jgi:hypothetical protein
MPTAPEQSAELKFAVTNTLIVQDIRRSVAFDCDPLGATVQRVGEADLPSAGQHLADNQRRRDAVLHA